MFCYNRGEQSVIGPSMGQEHVLGYFSAPSASIDALGDPAHGGQRPNRHALRSILVRIMALSALAVCLTIGDGNACSIGIPRQINLFVVRALNIPNIQPRSTDQRLEVRVNDVDAAAFHIFGLQHGELWHLISPPNTTAVGDTVVGDTVVGDNDTLLIELIWSLASRRRSSHAPSAESIEATA